jgi:hypothetical protein
MKKQMFMVKVSIVLTGLLFVMFIGNMPNTKELRSINPVSNTVCTDNLYNPGEIFYEDGWIGWIDPKLTDEPVPKPNKEKAKYKGSKVTEGGTTYISCPDAGSTCGRLYTVGPDGVKWVGMYLDDE